MNISLETIRTTLRGSFGKDSFIASFITNVQADESCPSAGIVADGVMRYNPAFVKQHITSPAELFCLVAHELMHPMFGHFVYSSGELENIAGDVVINAVISRVFEAASGNGALFQKLYEPVGITGLLRPSSQMHQSRYWALYDHVYQAERYSDKLCTGEVIHTLKVLTPISEATNVLLLGAHGNKHDANADDACTERFGKEVLGRIALDFRDAAAKNGKRAGRNNGLFDFFLDVLKTQLTLKRMLLERFATKRKVDHFKQSVRKPRVGVSPIPIQPSKRDFVLLAAGVAPFHYHNQMSNIAQENRGLAVYLDVSGSVNEYLPKIIGVLRRLEKDLTTVFLFSNEAVETPFRTLLQGKVQTTFGTDFNCIARSIMDQGFDKAVVVTDGYATMSKEHMLDLKEKKVRTLTILFGGKMECPEFAGTGDIVQLEDVVG